MRKWLQDFRWFADRRGFTFSCGECVDTGRGLMVAGFQISLLWPWFQVWVGQRSVVSWRFTS